MAKSITLVSGIGESTRGVLADHGFKTLADLAKANVDELAAVKGFGSVRAANTIAAAHALLEAAEGDDAPPAAEEPAKKDKKKKKDKDKKKKEKSKKKGKKKKKKK